MKKVLIFGLILTGLLGLLALLLYVPVWQEDARARSNRAKVYELIAVGHNLDDAEAALIDAGFELAYDEPITPTLYNDYYQQLVVVRKTEPNAFDTLAYATDCDCVPFTHQESPYVIINADLDGTITRVD